mgnify:FL=1
MLLPTESAARKDIPLCRGVLDYFPLALAEVARVSKAGNDQHNPGEPLHWSREKSPDHADCILRHLMERGNVDADGMRSTAKLAWRALALLQIELEGAHITPLHEPTIVLPHDFYGTTTTGPAIHYDYVWPPFDDIKIKVGGTSSEDADPA